jgi:hypothetical protein
LPTVGKALANRWQVAGFVPFGNTYGMHGYLTSQELAARIGVTRQRVQAMARTRGIVPVRVGNLALWRVADLPKFKRRSTGRPRSKGRKQ